MRAVAGRGRRRLTVALLAAAVAVGLASPASLAVFQSSAAAMTGFSAGHWANPVTYSLHNAVPNTGPSVALADLVADSNAATATTLYAYDTNCPSTGPGRALTSTNTNVPALCKYVNWITPAFAGGRTINGNVVLTAYFWLDNGQSGKNIVVDVTLNDYDRVAKTHTQFASLTSVTWSSPKDNTPANSIHSITVPVAAHQVPANDSVEIVVRGNVSTFAQRNVMVAYDTVTYPATLALP